MSNVDPAELNDFLEKVNKVKNVIDDLKSNESTALDKADKLIKQFESEKEEKEQEKENSKSKSDEQQNNITATSQLYRVGDGWKNNDHLYYCQRCKIEILYDIYDLDNNTDTLKTMIEEYNKECDEYNNNPLLSSSKQDKKNIKREKIRCGACPNCNNTNKNIVVSAQIRKDILQERVDNLKREYERKQLRRNKWEKYCQMKEKNDLAKTNDKEKEKEKGNAKSKKEKYFTDYEEWDLWEPEIDFDEYTEDGYIPDIPEAKALAFDMQKRHQKKQEQMKAATKEKLEGNKALKAQDYAGAIRHYSIGIDYCRDFKALYTNRGLAYMKTGQYKKCIDDCDAVIDMVTYIDTDEKTSDLAFKAYLRRANAHKLLGNLEDALTDARMCLKLRPKKQEVSTFIDDLQVLMYNERQRTKMKESMNEKKEQLQDFDVIFDKMVTYLDFEKRKENENENENENESESENNARQCDKLLNEMNRLMSFSFDYCIRFADRNGIELSCRYLQVSLQKLQKMIIDFSRHNDNDNTKATTKAATTATTTSTKKKNDDNNGDSKTPDIIAAKGKERVGGGPMKLTRKNDSKKENNTNNKNDSTVPGQKTSVNAVSHMMGNMMGNKQLQKREELVKLRVAMEMKMRHFARIFMMLNYCLANDVNLAFLNGKRSQIGYANNDNDNETDCVTTTTATTKKNETKKDGTSKIADAVKVAKAEMKKDKTKKQQNAILQQTNKQMQLIVGSLIFYIIRDFSKYTFDLQCQSMKFVSIATKIDSISSWLCQIHSKMVVKSIIEALSYTEDKKEATKPNTLKQRRNVKNGDKKNTTTKTTTEDIAKLERGFDLEALEYLFVTLINILNLTNKNNGKENKINNQNGTQFLNELMRFDKPYIFVGLMNKLNEFGNYILDSKSQLNEYSSKMTRKAGSEFKSESESLSPSTTTNSTTAAMMKQESLFLQKQHIVSIIFKILSKIFVNEQIVRAFVNDELVTVRIKSLLKHLTRLTDVFMVFEKYHLPTIVKLLQSGGINNNGMLANELLTQHGITMNQMAKCINVMLSLVHHGASHSVFLELNIHFQLFEMIGILYDSKYREMEKDQILSKNIENYNLIIDSIQDNILGFLDKISIYPEFDTMIETCDFTKYSLILKNDEKCKNSNNTMKFWQFILYTMKERQEHEKECEKSKDSNSSNKCDEKDSESENDQNGLSSSSSSQNNSNKHKYYFEACCIRILLRWLKRCLVGHASGESTNPYLPQIVESMISDNFSIFCTFLGKHYCKENTIVANITLVIKQFLIFCKNYNLYDKNSNNKKNKQCEKLSNGMITYMLKNDILCDLMNLFRSDDQTVRRNAVTLMAQLATFDESLKEKIRSIGAMTAMYQLQKEVVSNQ